MIFQYPMSSRFRTRKVLYNKTNEVLSRDQYPMTKLVAGYWLLVSGYTQMMTESYLLLNNPQHYYCISSFYALYFYNINTFQYNILVRTGQKHGSCVPGFGAFNKEREMKSEKILVKCGVCCGLLIVIGKWQVKYMRYVLDC
jgi:hypothetical protein